MAKTDAPVEDIQVAINGLTCKGCGHPVMVAHGVLTVVCGSCGRVHAVSGMEGLQKFFITPRVSQNQAQEALATWFGGFQVSGDFRRRHMIRDVYLVFLPMWWLHAQVIGWRLGYDIERTRTREGYYRERKVYHEHHVNAFFNWSDPACNPGNYNVKSVNPLGCDLEVYDQGTIAQLGRTEEVVETADVMRQEGRWNIIEQSERRVPLEYVTFEHFTITDEDFFLIWHPVWVVTYSYMGRDYLATIDGAHGHLHHARAPRSEMSRLLFSVGLAFIGNLFMAVMICLGTLSDMTGDADANMILLLVSIFAALVANFFGFKSLCYGSEVKYQHG